MFFASALRCGPRLKNILRPASRIPPDFGVCGFPPPWGGFWVGQRFYHFFSSCDRYSSTLAVFVARLSRARWRKHARRSFIVCFCLCFLFIFFSSGKPSLGGDGSGELGSSEVRCFALTLRHGEAYCSQAKTLAAYCTINREVRTAVGVGELGLAKRVNFFISSAECVQRGFASRVMQFLICIVVRVVPSALDASVFFSGAFRGVIIPTKRNTERFF